MEQLSRYAPPRWVTGLAREEVIIDWGQRDAFSGMGESGMGPGRCGVSNWLQR
jgi:hypothetical protein